MAQECPCSVASFHTYAARPMQRAPYTGNNKMPKNGCFILFLLLHREGVESQLARISDTEDSTSTTRAASKLLVPSFPLELRLSHGFRDSKVDGEHLWSSVLARGELRTMLS